MAESLTQLRLVVRPEFEGDGTVEVVCLAAGSRRRHPRHARRIATFCRVRRSLFNDNKPNHFNASNSSSTILASISGTTTIDRTTDSARHVHVEVLNSSVNLQPTYAPLRFEWSPVGIPVPYLLHVHDCAPTMIAPPSASSRHVFASSQTYADMCAQPEFFRTTEAHLGPSPPTDARRECNPLMQGKKISLPPCNALHMHVRGGNGPSLLAYLPFGVITILLWC